MVPTYTLIPIPAGEVCVGRRADHRRPLAPRRMDRAAVATTAIMQVVGHALRARCRGNTSAIVAARTEIEALLREEFHDIQRQTLNETRISPECE